MAPIDLSPPIFIDEPKALASLANRLAKETRVAVDTESNSLYAYQEQVCLIQFSTPQTDYLVDPLSLSDLAPLAAVFADRSIEKVFHAAEYDIMCLKRDFAFEIVGLFDTYQAARTLGWDKPGLANILEDQFGLHVNKRFQRANWGKRPLSQDMLDYARLDTHFLLALRDKLANLLKTQARWEEALELFAMMERVPSAQHSNGDGDFWSVTNARRLGPRQAAVLAELYTWRESEAEAKDRPPFKVMGDKALLSVAKTMPANSRELHDVPDLATSQVKRYGRQLLDAVSRGQSAPKPKRPHNHSVSRSVRDRYETLRTWRKETASRRLVDSDVILPRDLLWEIAKAFPHTPEALKEIMAPLPWRYEHYGQSILDVLHG